MALIHDWDSFTEWEPTNNDLDPTEPDPADYGQGFDYWDTTPAWMEYAALIKDDPLLGVLMGAPHSVIMPEGCSGSNER